MQEAIEFVQDVVANLEASKQPDTAEPILYLRMQLAQYRLLSGELSQCKDLVEEGREELDRLADVSRHDTCIVRACVALTNSKRARAAPAHTQQPFSSCLLGAAAAAAAGSC